MKSLKIFWINLLRAFGIYPIRNRVAAHIAEADLYEEILKNARQGHLREKQRRLDLQKIQMKVISGVELNEGEMEVMSEYNGSILLQIPVSSS